MLFCACCVCVAACHKGGGGVQETPIVVAASMFNTGHKHATKDGSTILSLHVIAKRLLEVRDQLRSFGRQMLQMWAWGGGDGKLDRVQLEDRTAVTHLCRGLTFV